MLLTPNDIRNKKFKTRTRFGHDWYDADEVDDSLAYVETTIQVLGTQQLKRLIRPVKKDYGKAHQTANRRHKIPVRKKGRA